MQDNSIHSFQFAAYILPHDMPYQLGAKCTNFDLHNQPYLLIMTNVIFLNMRRMPRNIVEYTTIILGSHYLRH